MESSTVSEFSTVSLRTSLILIFRVCLFVAGGSLAYLLFMFGHVEPELVSHNRVLLVAGVGGTCALIAALLQWIGLPTDPNTVKTKKKRH